VRRARDARTGQPDAREAGKEERGDAMNKRQKKKTQKERGYVLVSAWVPAEVRSALNDRAEANKRSTSAEIHAIFDAALGRTGA
jgi:hypothetical protein